MKKIILVCLALASCSSLLAQKSSPGFIVSLERDTIRGFIHDGTDSELSSEIIFKKTGAEEAEIKYEAQTILGFGFDYGRIFKCFAFLNPESKNDSVFVFAKRSSEGMISLYTYKKSKVKPDIFLVNNSSLNQVHLTEPKKFNITDENGHTVTGEYLRYMGLIANVKGDSVNESSNSKKLRYAEKDIQKNITKFNALFQDEFPIKKYHPQRNYTYDISAGIPMYNPSPVDIAFRGAFYISRSLPENSRKILLIRGISYRYAYIKSEIPSNTQFSAENFRQQFISLIPVGVKLQSDSKLVKPYVYIGVGLAGLIETNRNIENYEDKGNKTEFFLFPTINVGAGVKVKMGTGFLIAEVTPSGNYSGVFINLGYSF